MKTKIYIAGLLSTMLTFTGALFKINHFPGAGVLIILGLFILVIVFLPLALISHYKSSEEKMNPVLYIVTWITCAVCFSAMLFKIMHWPGAGYIMLVALPFPYVVFLPVFIAITSKSKNFNIYNTVFVLLLLTVISAFSALLALNVSKERMADSLSLARNYNNISKTMGSVSESPSLSPAKQKIAEIIGNMDIYTGIILKNSNIEKSQWETNPEIVLLSRSRESMRSGLASDKEEETKESFETGLSELMTLLEKDPDCKHLAVKAPEILGLKKLIDNRYILKDEVLITSQKPWPLINIAGLEANLKIIDKLLQAAPPALP